MKYVVIVPDGMADHPIEELGNKTPLQAAQKPNMDYLANHGMIGMINTIPEGMYPGSDIGNMSILGYDPRKCHTGRAPLEAANQNIILKENEVAFRCNLVTEENGKMADYSAGHISTKEAAEFINLLNQKFGKDGVKFHLGKSYRHTLVLRVDDPKKILNIKTSAPHDILNKEIKPNLPKGEGAEFLLELIEQSKSIFANHPVNTVRIDLKENPANMIWLWGQGTKPNLPLFSDKFGLKGGIISAVDLVNGIGRCAGLEIIDVPGITGYYDTNYLGKAEYALKSLKKNDFVYIHVESPDEAGHNGDVQEKIKAIENIDKHIIGTVLNHFNEQDDFRLVVLPDHPTPVKIRTHTHEPVGFAMYGKGIFHDGADTFDETTCMEKGIKFKSGEEMMEYFVRKFL